MLSSPLMTVRIMIVEDHPIVRQGYAQLVSQQHDLKICGEAESVNDALRVASECHPDLMIVDISLRDGSGFELIKAIHTRMPDVKMLVVSAHDETLFAERALRAGASGYINKQDAIEHLITALRDVISGELYLSEPMTQRAMVRSKRSVNEMADRPAPVDSLTNRELEVLQLLGEGSSTKQIARKLNLSPKTIDRHRENIKRKLELPYSNDLIRFATSWVLESR